MGQFGTLLYRSYGVILLLGYAVIFVTHRTGACGVLPIFRTVAAIKELDWISSNWKIGINEEVLRNRDFHNFFIQR